MPRTVQCAQCPKTFRTSDHRRRFCSRTCFYAYASELHTNRVTLICRHCGKEYLQKPSLKKTSHFCSRTCQHAHKSESGRTKLACTVCGTSFERINSRLGDFCSYRCMGQANRTTVSLTCVVCEKPFEVNSARQRCRETCSRACKRYRWMHTLKRVVSARGTTRPERIVQQALDSLGWTYWPQHAMLGYVADFFLPARRLIIEVDSDYWHAREENSRSDEKRDKCFSDHAITTVRLLHSEVKRTSDLAALISNRTNQPLKTPS